MQNEGGTRHFLRNSYVAFGLLVGIGIWIKIYKESFKITVMYESYLDWVIFWHIKRGRSIEDLARMFYCTDVKSNENRTN